VGITAGSREVPGRNACDRRHTYCIIIIIIIIIITAPSTLPHKSFYSATTLYLAYAVAISTLK